MPMYNLIEYCDNYSAISASLSGFKKDDIVNNANVTNDDNGNIGNTESNETKKGVKIAAPLKYLSTF